MSWFRSRYVQYLEAENARLKDENRRLLNIMLPRLGYNPLDEPAPRDLKKKPAKRLSWFQWGQQRAAALAKIPHEIILNPKPMETKSGNDKPAA